MNEYFTYRDHKTGYEIRQYTKGPERNAKLYFTTENFTVDDKYFFFNRQTGDGPLPDGGLYKCDVATGDAMLMADSGYRGFAMDRYENYGVLCRGNIVCRLDCDTGAISEVGELPKGGNVTGHLTTSKSGRIACSYQLYNKIYALVILDPKTGKSEVVHQSDYHLGHAQICPADENLIFYIHETGGDALQRTWMFDIETRTSRPYYVEHPNEWITHEVWSADGDMMAFMKLHGRIMLGDRDGRHFRQAAFSEQLLHPCLSRDKQWLCADRTSYLGVTVQDAVVFLNAQTGKAIDLATTHPPKTGADHQHPSFNRKGDMVLFSAPDESGNAQVCAIDLNQVQRP